MLQNYSKKLLVALAATSLLGMAVPSTSYAGAILKYGDTILGVNNEGHLNYTPLDPSELPADFIDPPLSSAYNGAFGLFRNGLGDATSPGCLCEGWGVAATLDAGVGSRIAGFASIDNGGVGGITDGIFGSTANTATSTVNLTDAAITVTHAYGPSLAMGVFQASVTITNNTGSAIDDVVYRRAMDWDIPPDEFNEYVTHGGVEANLESNGGNVRYASDNGFASVDPRDDAGYINNGTENTDFVDDGPTDHGSVFDFAFGSLAAGESRTFNIFYGSTANEADAISAINTLGANVWSFGQYSGGNSFGGDGGEGCDAEVCDVGISATASITDGSEGGPISGTPATFLFAFGGVGGVEPGDSAAVPVLPFVPAPGEFVFVAPEPRKWFDPPFADGFEYTLVGGGLFTEVMAPDASFGFGTIDIVIGGVVVGTLAPGDSFDLSPYTTSTFKLVGLGKVLDIADPDFATAFPVFLDFTGSPTELLMSALIIADPKPPTAASAPGIVLLFMGGFVAVFLRRRR
ncbi:MAG: hypothetical protein GW763_12030 [Paraglaciecola sp.]|nr:hypothetical protein [Paraglaciecola sp.]NCT48692.1 hypothetical protein [Paraglaciecola sp.]